jgi:PAS domain S-box-containing protein
MKAIHKYIPACLLFTSLIVIFSGCFLRQNSEQTGISALDGKWEYFTGTTPENIEDILKKYFRPLPSLTGLDKHVKNEEGIIWLRKDITIPDTLKNDHLSVLLGKIIIADETYFNGHFIGKTGKFPPHFFNEWTQYRNYKIPDEIINLNGKNTLLIKIYVHGEGMFSGRKVLGKRDEIDRIYAIEEFWNSTAHMLVAVLLISFSFYFLLLYLRRKKDHENLYYTLMCSSFVIYETNFFITRIPGFFEVNLSYLIYQKIIFISTFFVAYFLACFLRNFLSVKDKKPVRLALIMFTAIPIIIYLLPASYHSFIKIRTSVQIFYFPILIYMLYAIANAFKRKVREVYFVLFGFLPFLLCCIHDLSIQLFETDFDIYLLAFGFPFFLIAMLFILSNRFSTYRNRAEELNKELENEIIEKNEALKALQLSEEMFSKIFRLNPNGIVIFQITDEKFFNVNESFLAITGYERGEIIGKTYYEIKLFPSPEIEAQIHKALQNKTPLRNYETQINTKNGKTRQCSISSERVEIWGEPIELITVEDVTEKLLLEKEIINISELERQRIGQDLHDDLAPHLIGIDVLNTVLTNKLGKNGIIRTADLENISRLIREAADKTRRIARGLCPVHLVEKGLEFALKELAHNTEMIYNVSAKFEFNRTLEIDDIFLGTHIFNIVQESVHNAVNHGKADTILISLIHENEYLKISIIDNGKGFLYTGKETGMGLRIMQYRANMIGASFEISSSTDLGTTILITLKRVSTTIQKDK